MRFANINLLWIFILLPLWVSFLYLRLKEKRRRLSQFADQNVGPQICPGYFDILSESRTRIIFSTVVLACLILAVLRPQWGYTTVNRPHKGTDLVFAVDVSQSMMATDIKPSRIQHARREILDLLERLQGDRIALVAFAGISFLEVPLTVDYSTFRLFMDYLDPDLVPVKGTNIEHALLTSIKAFKLQSKKSDKSRDDSTPLPGNNSRAIILLTDGEDLSGNWENIKTLAKESNIRIYIIGIGTSVGAAVPEGHGFKRDSNGHIIVSRLNEKLLQDLASKTGGYYVTSTNSDSDTISIYEQGIKKHLTRHNLSNNDNRIWNEYFQWPLLLALLMIIGMHLRDLFSQLRTKEIQNNGMALFTIIFAASFLPCNFVQAESTDSVEKQARNYYYKGDFEHSLKLLQSLNSNSNKDFRIPYIVGANKYRTGDFKGATHAFLEALKLTKDDPKTQSTLLYNLANSLLQDGHIRSAIDTYKKGLSLNPGDKDIYDNLEYAKKLLQKQKNKNNQQKEKEKEKENNRTQQNKNNSTSSKKNSKDSANQDKQQAKPENNKTKQPQKKKEKEGKSSSSQDKDSEQAAGQENQQPKKIDPLKQKIETILGSISENKDNLYEYRVQKAIKEMKEQNIRPPKQDW